MEGDPDRNSIPRPKPYTSLVQPTSPLNTHGKCMIGVHSHTWTAISPTLLSPERYKRLHETHSRLHNHTDFPQNHLGLMSRYHPKAKTLNPQDRKLKIANPWAILPRFRQAIEFTFLTTTELFGSPLNCSKSNGSTHCSAFHVCAVFGAVINSFQFRWTGSCIANL